MIWYIRYAIGKTLIYLGLKCMAPGTVRAELEALFKGWNNIVTVDKMRKVLSEEGRKALAKLTHEMADMRVDGLISDYENRVIETAARLMPCEYTKLISNLASDFFYAGYSISETEIKIIIKNLMDRKILTYDGNWMIRFAEKKA